MFRLILASVKDKGIINTVAELLNYRKYLKTQLQRSKHKSTANHDIEDQKKKYLVGILSEKIEFNELGKTLVIGCRNSMELDLIEKSGAKDVIGIDLFSSDSRIKVMDMHDLKFADRSFDLVYCSHALEHSYAPDRVISEMVRVLNNNGYIIIEVPVNYEGKGRRFVRFQELQ